MPDNVRLFRDFEVVLRTLERLDPDRKTPFYPGAHGDLSNAPKGAKAGLIREILETAVTIDEAARMLLSFAIDAAAAEAVDAETQSWLKQHETINLLDNPPLLRVVIQLYGSKEKQRDPVDGMIEELETRLNSLKTFEEAVSGLQFLLMAELDEARSQRMSKAKAARK